MQTAPLENEARTTLNRLSLAIALAVVLALWLIPQAGFLVYPIRLFVTIVHEGSHALATLLTGGSVQRIEIYADGSGVTLSLGGNPAAIYMAGYVGATAAGVLLLRLAAKSRSPSFALSAVGCASLTLTALWIRNPLGFGWGLGIGLALVLAGARLQLRPGAFLLSFLAIQLCANALFDLRGLVFMTTKTGAENDAVFMAREFGFAPWFWSLLWSAVSALIVFFGLRGLTPRKRPVDAIRRADL